MLKSRIMKQPAVKEIVIDFKDAPFIDHTVMTRLNELKGEFAQDGRKLSIEGLDHHRSMSHDPLSSRKLVHK